MGLERYIFPNPLCLRCTAYRLKKLKGSNAHNLAGYVRVSANTYTYGLRRGFALLVTGVTL